MTRLVVALAAVLAAVPLGAQQRDLSGTWQLDAARSRVDPAAGLAGLIAAGAPKMIHVTQAANGNVILESEVNEGHARIYRPGGKTATPAGAAATVTMASAWQDGRLVSEGTHESTAGTAPTVRPLKEVISLSGDGTTLTIEVTMAGPPQAGTSTLVYTRATSVGPCTSWPTPCKMVP